MRISRSLAIVPVILLLSSAVYAEIQYRLLTPNSTAGCTTSSPTSGSYTVTICLTAPASGSTLTGDTTVTATVSTSGSAPYVQRVVFYLDGAYVLTDYQSTYTFQLPTAQWADGGHSLSAEASLHDGFISQRAAISVNFSNGATATPGSTSQFSPTSGRTPASGSPFIVAAVGDGASGEVNAGKVSNLIRSLNPNLFLYLGDIYEEGSPTEFNNWYGTPSTFFDRLRSITDPTVGNHEYLTPGAKGYFDYWNNVPKYYTFSANGWNFFSINSNGADTPTGAGSAEYNWLQQQLAALPAGSCTIVYYHHPLFNIGSEKPATGMSDMWKLMAQYGVDIVLNGHDHDYQRWVPLDGNGQRSSNGITEFVVGTGGHGLQNFTTTDSRVAYSNNKNPTAFGALLLQLNSSGANFTFRSISGTVLDSGVIPCVPSTADSQAPSIPGGFMATATSTNRVDLSWTPSSDNTGVVGYTIYRNGSILARVSANVPATQVKYIDKSVSASTTYKYSVDAYDLAGNHSAGTGVASVLTPGLSIADNADTYVNAASPASNYGGSTVLRADGLPDEHSYLRFNVSNLNGAAVTMARLVLYGTTGSNAGINSTSVSDNSWDEMTLTYANAPPLGSVLSSSGIYRGNNWISLDVSSYVKSEGTYSFGITTTGSTSLTFSSKEDSVNPPRLLLNLAAAATPTPTAAALAPPALASSGAVTPPMVMSLTAASER